VTVSDKIGSIAANDIASKTSLTLRPHILLCLQKTILWTPLFITKGLFQWNFIGLYQKVKVVKSFLFFTIWYNVILWPLWWCHLWPQGHNFRIFHEAIFRTSFQNLGVCNKDHFLEFGQHPVSSLGNVKREFWRTTDERHIYIEEVFLRKNVANQKGRSQ